MCKNAVLAYGKILYCNMLIRIKRNYENVYQRIQCLENSLNQLSPSYKSDMLTGLLQTKVPDSSTAVF
jgi:hypothetical protein